MKIVDLSHNIHAKIPVFPGTKPPSLTATNSIEQDGFAETLICMYSHTATHMDAPAHILKEGRSLDQFTAEQFFGPACIADVSHLKGKAIGVANLQPLENRLAEVDFLLLKTGWSQYWGEEGYFSGFPFLSASAAAWLTNFKLKGIGIDAISVDPVADTALAAHQQLLSKEILIIENLTNLKNIGSENFYFSCLPLKLRDADGSPIRAVAIEDLKN